MSDFDGPEIYRSVLESLQTGVYLVDCNRRILFWNDGAEKITGYLRQDVVGAFCRDQLISSDPRTKNVLADAAAALSEAMREGRPTVMDVSLRHKAGHRIFVRLRAVPIRNSRGVIIGAAETFEEDLSASDWNRRQSKLADYGCLDAPTGVLNEALTLSHLRESIATYAEHRVPFSVLLVEIDRIDRLRATYGAAVIAAVLRVAALRRKRSKTLCAPRISWDATAPIAFSRFSPSAANRKSKAWPSASRRWSARPKFNGGATNGRSQPRSAEQSFARATQPTRFSTAPKPPSARASKPEAIASASRSSPCEEHRSGARLGPYCGFGLSSGHGFNRAAESKQYGFSR
jgi:PAS domain S-box-containing protein